MPLIIPLLLPKGQGLWLPSAARYTGKTHKEMATKSVTFSFVGSYELYGHQFGEGCPHEKA